MSSNNRSKFTIAIVIIAGFVLMVLFLSALSALVIGFFVILIAYYINSKIGKKSSSQAKPIPKGSAEAASTGEPEGMGATPDSIFQTPRLKVIRNTDSNKPAEPEDQK